jgi:serine/threonine protein kinase
VSVQPAGSPEARPRPRIGRYLIVGRIGRGGMGMVYRGLDEVLEREVAVKTLTVEGTLDEESRKRFEIEAKAAAKLQHPNIVTVFELGEDRGLPFIAMELLPGVDLETLLRSGEPLLLQEKLDVMIQVCRGLAYAHESRIVHRDVKPSNIRLLDDGTAKIMDFGIAKLGATSVTRSGMMVGTLNYMSPEQIRGKRLDGRSDVFSAGVILYQLLEGRRPFGGKGTEILYRIVQDEPPPLSADLGSAGPRLRQIVERALAKEPELRYGGAALLAEDLSDVLSSYTRAALPPVPAADLEAVNRARRALKERRVEDSVRCLHDVVQRNPHCLEARRALRLASREMQRRQRPPEPESDAFPELDATFQSSPPTQRSPETFVSRSAAPPVALRTGTGKWLLLVGGIALCAAVGSGIVLVRSPERATRGAGDPPPQAPPTLESRVRPPLQPPVPPAPQQDAVPQQSAAPTVPVAASVKVVSDARASLEPAGPPGTVSVVSAYPLDVLWRGKPLARGELSPRLSLPPGRQVLTLVSAAHFLKASVDVEVRGGQELRIQAPGLGKISIRANPDNCEVHIDGAFVDYPPIFDKPLAEGKHTIAFKWPDGTRREEVKEVARGRIAYVTGRKD